MKQTILSCWKENGTLSMIIKKQIMKKEMKSSIMQKILKSNLCDYNGAYIL